MSRIDQTIYALFGLAVVMVIGMVTNSWRAVLYPFLIMVGLAIFLGLIKDIRRNPRKIWIPVTVTAIYLFLYIFHDVITMDSPTGGKGFIWGLSPAMALYIFGIWPLAVLVCLLYTLTFQKDSVTQQLRQDGQKNINM
ncbi:hypothetical protein MHB50_15180 [Siminovitchia sp. FSL H7-0308]|jgi:hypothetical protein|uniref:Transmembrane protein n=1 Tax=Siminovitchia thermophila TaxID=1245522 RepID=A0ABS2R4A1_9BACI|nr:hypothetical protein [Siminovitchia thermophila]MBM7714230.1 hypothetical protein [Siminovitchia thermophila]ONK23059.1 hypothetical protein BLX87_12625 [Bacillus sp. VT-16-64]